MLSLRTAAEAPSETQAYARVTLEIARKKLLTRRPAIYTPNQGPRSLNPHQGLEPT